MTATACSLKRCRLKAELSPRAPLAITSAEQVRALAEIPIGPTRWLTLTQERIAAFADVTDDHQWIHVDTERAASGPFGRTVVHGYLTLALLPRFAKELFEIQFGSMRLNYGLNRVRFPSATPVGSRIRTSARFTRAEQSTSGLLITTEYVVAIENGTKPACVAEMLVLVR